MPYLLPDLGEGMAEAEIVRWQVAVGDHVTRDQIVVYVQTDKAEVELPVPASGTITALGGEVGDLVPVGGTLLEFVPDAGATLLGTQVRAALPAAAAAVAGTAARSSAAATAVQAAPPVRKLARDLGVDLAAVAGTGPGGRVTAGDVRAFRRSESAGDSTNSVDSTNSPGDSTSAGGDSSGDSFRGNERRVALRGIRRAMAHNMAEAWRAVPHITLFDEIDARPLLAAHASARESLAGDALTLTAFFVRAAVVALGVVPILNASLDEPASEIVYHDDCHVGIAVATDAGLTVPVLHDARTLTLLELGREIARLTESARAGGLSPETLRGATFTVTNFGTEGGRFATPIVRPPQVAILGFGAIRIRPVVADGEVVAAPTLPLSLSADHRIVDGHDATRFFEHVAALLADPEPPAETR
jgi:pyruvate dehydrogenase E2 component (dihydrolipoamide acetyltransferase)